MTLQTLSVKAVEMCSIYKFGFCHRVFYLQETRYISFLKDTNQTFDTFRFHDFRSSQLTRNLARYKQTSIKLHQNSPFLGFKSSRAFLKLL